MKRLLFLGLLALGLCRPASAEEARRAPVAFSDSADGMILRREAGKKEWQAVKKGEDLYTGDLLIGLPGAVALSRDGNIEARFQSDLTGASPYPIIETAIVLQEAKNTNLCVLVDRGRIDLVSRKPSGAAKATIRVGAGETEATLEERGARVAFEVYGRWAAGTPFRKVPKPGEAPRLDLVVLVLKGHVDFKGKHAQVAMHAPPGPALLHLESGHPLDFHVQKLDTLPKWAEEADTDDVKARRANLEKFRLAVGTLGVEKTLIAGLASDDANVRRLAVLACGALDELPLLAGALLTTKNVDLFDHGILALRHWIGRAPGQDQLLYKRLTEEGKVPARDAEAMLQLLHDFGDNERAQPETYEMLIAQLRSERPFVRALAHWHLFRLVPAGKKIAYNPLADKAARDKAALEWKTLIPEGTVPARTVPEQP